ncbi:pentatricopeptide repeat protein [Talaromyces stipitatus ATCC 10500]|uniref:Pentatricopeptide repeat protein n=1 Tax=Talaromyces stipitatus (strain ATCC 10500 / CBS 375.48 / QM 6759 / NRRL 1006) TaxID=441959 RepID=B8LTW0_TALSN|nr:pentatricopeptide repeat protein [Talaromyces stipitatus ATCC 10500]EED23790.1 pentatricopeptide repeat protein [Talaromyces stipitatus ATCC 10500]
MHSQRELNRHGRNKYGRIVQRRPAVAAVADVFIQSLVLAGFCPDHAPKQRAYPVHNQFSSIRYRAFGTSANYSNNKQSPSHPSIGLPTHSFNPRAAHIQSQPLSTYAAKSEIDDRDPRPVGPFSSIRVNNKVSASTERAPEPMILGSDDRRTMRQMKESIESSPHNASAHISKTRHTVITSAYRCDRRRQVEHPFTFKYHEKWMTHHNGRVKPKWPKNHIGHRLKEPTAASAIQSFMSAVRSSSKSNQYVFGLYKRLPSPGLKLLSFKQRSRLLYRFAHPPDRRRCNARYFLTLFKDMIDAGFKLSRSLCTSAIYFTSHKEPKLNKRDLMDAIAIWHRMETIYDLKADNVVFELLFRIASLSGHFGVGDRLIQEMKNRKLQLSLQGYLSILYSYGKRGDTEGIRKAFQELVSSGKVVNTTVINCLISSLLNAGDFDTAEQIYSRMMQDHARTTGSDMTPVYVPSMSADFHAWRSRNNTLTKVFEAYLAVRTKEKCEHGRQLHIPFLPDSRTFSIMLRFHCLHTGDLMAIRRLLSDMEKVFENPPNVIVYYFLFRGFALHSSAKGWTEVRLLELWKAFKSVLYDSYTQLDHFENSRLPLKPVNWENPLKSLRPPQQGSQSYSQASIDGQIQTGSKITKENTVGEDKKHGNEFLMALFDQLTKNGRLRQLHQHWIYDKKKRRRIYNAMFLSRELNVVILKAFGSHCGVRTLFRVYSDIEKLMYITVYF